MKTTGNTVGTIYAFSTAGSIVGTFLTGFLLIELMGVRAIVISVGVVLLLLAIASSPALAASRNPGWCVEGRHSAQICSGIWNKFEQMDACLDACVVMPNHVYGILVMGEAGLKPASTEIVRHGPPEIVQIYSGTSSVPINPAPKPP